MTKSFKHTCCRLLRLLENLLRVSLEGELGTRTNVVGSELANQFLVVHKVLLLRRFGFDRHLDSQCNPSHIVRVDLDLYQLHELRLDRFHVMQLGDRRGKHTHPFGKREPLSI